MKYFDSLSLRTKIGLLYYCLVTIAVSLTFALMLSKLLDLYNDIYQAKIKDNLSSLTFLHREYEKILFYAGDRVVKNKSIHQAITSQDHQQVEQKLQEIISLETLDFAYVVYKENDHISLIARGHKHPQLGTGNIDQLSQKIFIPLLTQAMRNKPSNLYIPLTPEFLREELSAEERIPEADLGFFFALPFKTSSKDGYYLVAGRRYYDHPALKSRMRLLLNEEGESPNGLAVMVMSQSSLLYAVGDQEIIDAMQKRRKDLSKSVSQSELRFTFSGRVVDGASYQLKDKDAYIIVLSDRTKLKDTIWQAAGMTTLIVGVMMLVFLFILNWFLRNLFASIKNLEETTNLMEAGDLSARAKVMRKDELGSLAKRFNLMAKSLQEKMRQISIQSEKEKQLIKAQTESELRSLRSHMQPHFLFNSLHMISSMVEIDPKGSKDMLKNLGDLYRLLLYSATSKTSPLSSELEIVDRYLNLQKKRFGNRLEFSIKTQVSDQSQCYIPGLILQTLVENALKYGVEDSIEGGRITIEITRHSDGMYLARVTNSGLPLKKKIEERMGLANTKERLSLLYNDKHDFKLWTNDEGLTEARFYFSGEKL